MLDCYPFDISVGERGSHVITLPLCPDILKRAKGFHFRPHIDPAALAYVCEKETRENEFSRVFDDQT